MSTVEPASGPPPAVLEIRDLHADISVGASTVHAVHGVDLTIRQGETVALVGESGCGKSMTGMSIPRLLPAGGRIVSGDIIVCGQRVSAMSETELRAVRGPLIGVVYQDPMTALNPSKTVGFQVGEPLRLHTDMTRAQITERVCELLATVGIPRPRERLKSYPHQLSGGLRQRVLIAQALACEPKLLIADEPTTALDVSIQAQILDLLASLQQRLQMSTLLITHDMGVVAGRADRMAVMYAGEIVEQGSTTELFGSMRHPYTQALLASTPTLTHDRDLELLSIPGQPPDLSDPPAGCRFAARCRFATAECESVTPDLQPSAGGQFACFHPVDGPMGASSVAPIPVIRKGADATEPLVVVDSVRRAYAYTGQGQRFWQRRTFDAVSEVDLTVNRGETFGLVGESGCGKSTLARMLVGLDNPTAGTVRVEGRGFDGNRSTRRAMYGAIQLMFQDPYSSLDPRMSVAEIIREPLQAQRRGSPAEQRARVVELLEEVGLPASAAQKRPHQFSGGQRQRVGLARALALRPTVLVADEPVSALDVSVRSQVLNLINRVRAEYDLTLILISHDLAVVRYMADRIAVMYLGKIVEVGTCEDVYQRPLHHYTLGLLRAVPTPDPQRERNREGRHLAGEIPSPMDPPSGCRFRTRCPAAQDLCATTEPELRELRSGQSVACHFPLQAQASLMAGPRPDHSAAATEPGGAIRHGQAGSSASVSGG